MSFELCYTSAPKGLRPGTKDFCTVALTVGTPNALADVLESLSGYRPLYPAGSARAAENPVSWAHWEVSAGGQSYGVLSRVGFAGLDHTHRSNKFAHHVALTAAERPAGGPAWALAHGDVMRTAWAGEPREFAHGPRLPNGDRPPGECRAWAAACGDAGWAGALAQTYLESPAKPVYVIVPPTLDALPLVVEAMALVPPRQRWALTFNTYYTDPPAGSTCVWRFCVAGSAAADDVARSGTVVLDLTAALGSAPDGPLARQARGETPAAVDESRLLEADDADAADLMPLAGAPGASGRAPRFRSAAALAPRRAGSPDDWMPPASATAVETGDPPQAYRQRSALTSPAAAAAIAGAIVGLAVYLPMNNQLSQAKSRAMVELNAVRVEAKAAADRRDEAVAKYDEAVSRHAAELTVKVNAARDQGRREPDPGTWMRVPSENDPAAKKYTQAELDHHVAEARKSAVPPPSAVTVPANATPDPAALSLRSIESAPIADAASRCFPVERLANPTAADEDVVLARIDNPNGPLRCTLVAPGGLAKSRCELVADKNMIGVPKKGAVGYEELCSIVADKSTVKLHWRKALPEDDAARKALLKYCMLTVSSGSSAECIQFAEPESLGLVLNEQAGVACAPPPGAPAAEAVMVVLSTGSPWRPMPADTAKGVTRFTAPGVPAVDFTLANGNLSSNFLAVLSEKTEKLRKDQELLAAAKGAVASAVSAAEKAGRKVDDLKSDPVIAGLRADEKARQHDWSDAREAVRTLLRFPSVAAFVRLKNGVTTHRIDVRTTEPAAE